MEEETIWEGSPHWIGRINLGLAVAGLFFGILPGILYIGYVRWATQKTEYQITTERILTREGGLSTEEHQIDLLRLKDISSEQGFLQGLLNVGDIRIETTDRTHPSFTLESVPEYSRIREQIWESSRNKKDKKDVDYRQSL